MYAPERMQGKNVSAYKNKEFFAFATMTGRGLLMSDPRVPTQVLTLDSSPELIGEVLRSQLSQSTVLSNQEFAAIFNSGAVQEKGKLWDEAMCKQLGYNSRRSLYRHMLQCNVTQLDDRLTFEPTCHDRLDGWKGVQGVDSVVIRSDSSPTEVAAALSEAFSRCTSKVS